MQPLSEDQTKSVALVCGDNTRLRELFAAITARQTGSIAWHARAQAALSGAHSQLPYAAPILPICVERAEGARIHDVDGNEYIDCHMAYTASILGHRPSPVVRAIERALARGLGPGHFVREQVELAELVKAMVPGLERVALFHAGGEAVAASARLARAATGRRVVAKFEGCYHGWHELGLYNTMMILSGRLPTGPLDAIAPEPATAGVTPGPGDELAILPFNVDVALETLRRHADSLACVIVDPVPPFMAHALDEARAFVQRLAEACASLGIPLVLDEVVSGFRLAEGGARTLWGLPAAMTCYGKLTSGLGIPLAIVGGDARILDLARTSGVFADYRAGKAWISSTHSGNLLAVVASLAALRHLHEAREDIYARLDANHALLADRVREFSTRSGIRAALVGHPRLQSMITLDAIPDVAPTYRAIMGSASPWSLRPHLALTFYLRQRGVYTKTVPTMNLSAAHTAADVEQIADAIESSLTQMRADGALPA